MKKEKQITVSYSDKVIDLIKTVVAGYYETPITAYKSRSRKRNVITIKQVSVYFIRKFLPKLTLSYIGEQMGYNHATVLHCVKSINNLVETDKQTRIDIDNISKNLKMQDDVSLVESDINDYYYINLSTCHSLKLPDEKDMVLVGWSEREVETLIDLMGYNKRNIKQNRHKNTGLFLLEKKAFDFD